MRLALAFLAVAALLIAPLSAPRAASPGLHDLCIAAGGGEPRVPAPVHDHEHCGLCALPAPLAVVCAPVSLEAEISSFGLLALPELHQAKPLHFSRSARAPPVPA